MRIHGFVLFAVGVSSRPLAWNAKRDLFGLLEADSAPTSAGTDVGSEVPPVLGSMSEDSILHAVAGSTALHHQASTTSAKDGATPQATLTASSSPTSTQRAGGESTRTKGGGNGDASSTIHPTASITTVSAVNNNVSSTPPGELTQWKVIGISIICVGFVAIVVMAITFFDTWSAFVRDILGCGGWRKGKDDGMSNGKELVPDWDRRTWEFNLANEDGHRYPTQASVDSMAKIYSPNERV